MYKFYHYLLQITVYMTQNVLQCITYHITINMLEIKLTINFLVTQHVFTNFVNYTEIYLLLQVSYIMLLLYT